jgi:hypothetical protein
MSGSIGTAFYQLIYLSEPVAGLNDLMEMISKAQKFNQSQDISGMLVIKSKSLFQLIEGPEEEVRALYKKIKGDKRHKNPGVIYEGHSSIRNMPFLGMALTIDFEENDDDRKIFLFDKKEAIKFGMLVKGPVKEYLMNYLDNK